MGAGFNNSPGFSSTQELIRRRFTLTSAQILNLNSSPVVLLAAPGAGMSYDVISVLARHNFLNAVYATNVNLRIKFSTTTSQAIANNSNILTQNNSLRWGRINLNPFASGSLQYVSNDDVVVDVATGNPTGGSGSLDIWIAYMVLLVD